MGRILAIILILLLFTCYCYADTKTWYPITDSVANMYNSSDSPPIAIDNYSYVDDPAGSPDEDATYVYPDVAAYYNDYYVCGNSDDPVPDGATGISITVYYRYRFYGNPDSPTEGEASAGIYYNFVDYLDTYNTGKSQDWTNDSVTFDVNPETTDDWTVEEINSVLIELSGLGRAAVIVQFTQVYAIVTYTPAASAVGKVIAIYD